MKINKKWHPITRMMAHGDEDFDKFFEIDRTYIRYKIFYSNRIRFVRYNNMDPKTIRVYVSTIYLPLFLKLLTNILLKSNKENKFKFLYTIAKKVGDSLFYEFSEDINIYEAEKKYNIKLDNNYKLYKLKQLRKNKIKKLYVYSR